MRVLALFVSAVSTTLTCCSLAHAQLEWHHAEVRVQVDWEQDVITARFPFSNTGDYPLTIQKIETSDPVVHAHVGQHRIIEKGQSGAVVVTLTNRGVFGPLVYTALVSTDERRGPQMLTLHVVPQGWDNMTEQERTKLADDGERLRALPPPLAIEPRLVRWLPGQPPEERTITVTVQSEDPVHIARLLPTGKQTFRHIASLKSLEPGRKYLITVKPESNDAAGSPRVFSTWTLDTDMGADLKRRQRMFGALRIAAITLNQQAFAPLIPDSVRNAN